MWWLIAMFLSVVLVGSRATRNRHARARFEAQRKEGTTGAGLSAEVLGLLRDGHRIRALKQFRKETGLGLKNAKHILDTAKL